MWLRIEIIRFISAVQKITEIRCEWFPGRGFRRRRVQQLEVHSDVRPVVGVHLAELRRDVLLRFDHCLDALRQREEEGRWGILSTSLKHWQTCRHDWTKGGHRFITLNDALTETWTLDNRTRRVADSEGNGMQECNIKMTVRKNKDKLTGNNQVTNNEHHSR